MVLPPAAPIIRPLADLRIEENHLARARREADEARRMVDAALALDADRRVLTKEAQRARLDADVAQVRDMHRAQQAAEALALDQEAELRLMRQRQADELNMLHERERLDRQRQANELAADRERHFDTTQQHIAQIAKEREKQRQEQNQIELQRAERELLAKFEAEEGVIRENKIRDNAIRLQNQENLELDKAATARDVQISDEQRMKQLKEEAAMSRRAAALAADETRKAQDSFARWERAQIADEADAERRKSALAKLESEKARLLERKTMDELTRLSMPISADPLLLQAMYPSATARLLSPTAALTSVITPSAYRVPTPMYPSYSAGLLGSKRLDAYGYGHRHPLDDPLVRYGVGVTQVGIPGVDSSVSKLKRDIMRSLPQ